MTPGRASQTAVMVCMARAVAHGASLQDPTALVLLPDAERARVMRFRAGERPRGLRERMDHVQLRLGEPIHSAFTPDATRELLARYRFTVQRDEDMCDIGARLSPEIAKATRMLRHLRIVTADRA